MSQELDYKKLMTQALQELQTLRSRVRELESAQPETTGAEPIAIIGMGCRLPGAANSPAQFWQNLCDGVDAIAPIPRDRWAHPTTAEILSGGFIDNLREFDATFFGISPKEAVSLDPQQRLLLEVHWEALEQAGIIPASLTESNTGIFVGISSNDYSGHLLKRPYQSIDAYLATGNSHSTAAGRIAFTLGLQGPAIAIDTACSSSLVAIHLACQSLRQGECNIAIASGVNRILAPEFSINFSRANMLAPDGRCKTFDATADGFGRAEGAGAIVLKRLSDIRPSDHVFAIIRGSAVNQDGRSSGLTVPNGPAQQKVIQQALRQACLRPDQIDYIEAHGTGTALGDPIELGALQAVFGEGRDRQLIVGSTKTNLGHLEAAAGIAGLIKTVLVLYHCQVPPHLHFQQGNPKFDWEDSKIAIPTTITPLAEEAIAGVSSFGFSGTNAHIILASPTHAKTHSSNQPLPQILTLSAKSPAALQELKSAYLDACNELEQINWADICTATQLNRSHFLHRDAAVVRHREDVIHFLQQPSIKPIAKPKIAFLFTGQGSQYSGMGQALYESQPVFKQHFDRCADLFAIYLDIPLAKLLFDPQYTDRLDQTQYTQPVMFSLEYALAKLWNSWGIKPDVMLGHSLGEYVAAHLAGVFSLEDAIKLVGKRARLMQELPQIGKMVMVEAPVEQVRSLLETTNSSVEIAAINSQKNTVISGDARAIDQCLSLFGDRHINYQSLKVSQAFHSALMDIILIGFQQTLSQVKLFPPQCPIVSDHTGEIVGAEMATAEYWCRHLRHTVQFQKGIETLAAMDCNCFVEIGAKSTLINLGQAVLAAKTAENPTLWLASLSPTEPQQTLIALAEVYRHGVSVNWPSIVNPQIAKATTLLPTYPFQRDRYWIDADDIREIAIATTHPLLGHKLEIANPSHFFAQSLTLSQPHYLADHVVFDHVILPAAAYLEMAIAAAIQTASTASVIKLQNVKLQQPVALHHQSTIIQTTLHQDSTWMINSKTSRDDRQWLAHAQGEYAVSATTENQCLEAPELLTSRYSQTIDADRYYQQLTDYGIAYGEYFQAIQQIWYEPNQAIAQIKLPKDLDSTRYHLHPVLLDACFQAIGATMLDAPPRFAFLPIAVNQLQFHQPLPANIWAKIELVNRTSTALSANVTILAEDGTIAAQVLGLQLKAVKPSHLHKILSHQTTSQSKIQPLGNAPLASQPEWRDWLYQIAWQPQPNEAPTALLPAITSKIAPEFTQLLNQPHLPAYASHLENLESVSVIYIINALINSGFSPKPGDRFSLDQLTTQLKIQAQHQRLCQRLLQILVETHYLIQVETIYQVQTWPATAQPITWSETDKQQADVILLDRCGTHLTEVLQGDINPLQLLFPNGDWTILTQLYQNSPGTQITNELVRQALLEIAATDDNKLRILEIGAGTGGTTAHLLASLNESIGDRFEYTFTDISPIFLAKAKQRFENYAQVKYQLLNIEQSIAEQGFNLASFDVIIAANVLHATADLAITARQVQELLKPSGHLILVEGVRPARWLDLIFGLTEGWWCFNDRRSDYPLVTSTEWQDLLQSQGFDQAHQIQPIDAIPSGLDQQAVIIAQKSLISPQNWLILADESSNYAKILLTQLLQFNQAGKLLSHHTPQAQLLEHLATADQVIYLAVNDDIEFQPTELIAYSDRFLQTLQALTSQTHHKTPQITLVTETLSLNASSLIGIGKVAGLEHPQLHYRSISIANFDSNQSNENLIHELLHPTAETHIRLGDQREVQRLERYDLPDRHTPKQLTITAKGNLSNLQWQPMQRRSPLANEVEIAIKATGLNLIDVLDALALLPFERNWFGVECAGEVVAVGQEVSHLQVGDRVIALAPGSFQDFVTVQSDWVVKQPDRLENNHQAAATIPANFLTAYYSLHQLAQIKSGDRVLIHSAASGTGMAAVQIAQWLGAEVYATASPSKWETLKAMGIQHIFHSRNLDFANAIPSGTIDVVFNALSGEFIPKSLALLKPAGQFIEIGKREIWTTEQMTAARSDVVYHIIDLMQVAQDQPQQIRSMLEAIMQLIQTKAIQPLPQQSFSSSQVVEAFRAMQQAQHIGKIVVNKVAIPNRPLAPNTGGTRIKAPSIGGLGAYHIPQLIDPDRSYLITGGFGGLGLKVAEWLSQQGAQQLILVGHHAPNSVAEATITAIRGKGTQVKIAVLDVCDYDGLKSLLQSNSLPLDGVFHAAGQLDDGTIQQLNGDRLQSVMSPKVQGAWNLHELTQHLPLRYFVCFSSAASLLSSPGQANHVAANAFLDTIVHYRQQLGLPALSINWGAWSDIGAAAKRQVKTQMAQRGIGEIPPEVGIEVLAQLLESQLSENIAAQTVQIGVIPINWHNFPHHFKQNPFFQVFQGKPSKQPSKQPSNSTIAIARQSSQPATSNLLDRLPKSNPEAYLIQYLQTEFAQVLGLKQERPDPNLGFFDMGMDSLMTVELQNRLETAIAQKIPTSVFFEHPTIKALADYLTTLLNAETVNIDIPKSNRLNAPILEPPKLDSPPAESPPNQLLEVRRIEQELLALETLLKS